MPQETRKARIQLTPEQRREYAKLMVDENYTNKAAMELSGADTTAVTRWKKQYIAEQQGDFVEGKIPLDEDKRRIQALEKQLAFVEGKIPLDADKRRIQALEKQLAEAREDVRLLKKPTPCAVAESRIEVIVVVKYS